MSALTLRDYAEALRRRLRAPLPGAEAQLTMAPAYRQNRALADVRGKRCRDAGVLALLHPLDDGTPALLLTVRHADLKQHAGQVSFPGGRREPDEDLADTALREAHEEVGIRRDDVDLLGTLTPLYIPPSNFCVYPFVGALTYAPAVRPERGEVDAVLSVPLHVLLHDATRKRADWTLRGRTVDVPYFDVSGYEIWGATAMMLAELLAVLPDAD